MDVLNPRAETFIKLYGACGLINDSKLVGDVSICNEVMPKEDYFGLLSLNAIKCL